MAVNFSNETKIDPDELRPVSVGLEALGNSASIEIWRVTGKVTCHREGRIGYCQNNDFLFGHLLADEKDSNKLNVLIEDAYTEINTFLHSTSFPHVFRFWNYIPGVVNQVENGVERHKEFCVGLYTATSLNSGFERTLPAASAVGTDVPGLLISFASEKQKGYTYLFRPRILHWEDRATEWSGRSDKIRSAFQLASMKQVRVKSSTKLHLMGRVHGRHGVVIVLRIC